MAEARKPGPRVFCPACRKRVGRDKAKSTKEWVVYPTKCTHCAADLRKTLKAADLATRPKPKPKAKPAEKPAEPDKGGRPTSLSQELIDQVGQFLRIGAYNTTVMKALGVKERTWYAWIDKAVKAEAKSPSKLTHADRLYLAFAMEVEQAEAEGELACLLKVNRGSIGWQGSAWILERKHPDRWGRSRSETPAGGGLEALVDAIAKARSADG